MEIFGLVVPLFLECIANDTQMYQNDAVAAVARKRLLIFSNFLLINGSSSSKNPTTMQADHSRVTHT